MRHLARLCLASTLCAAPMAAHAGVDVVASIKPVHSLVAAVMQGVGEPGLIVEGAGSPHSFAMKPSQARMLEEAEIVFWIGPELEAFLEKPLGTVAAKARSVALIDAEGLLRLPIREGGAFDTHDHAAEAGHAGHDHGHGHDHDHEAEKAGHDDHDHGAFDAHVWLDPVNAKVMVAAIAEALSAADPDNAAAYAANADAEKARLDALTAEISTMLEPVKDRGFIVFHDAYRYFEARFGLEASGSITVSPEVLPGAERVAAIRDRINDLGAACVFAEPQFEPKLVTTVTEGTKARAGVLDPLGAGLDDGTGLYDALIRAMATAFRDCFAEAG